VDGVRYVVCRNEAEAEKDRADRQAIVEGLEKQLRKGDKALIGNSAYRRRVRNEDGPDRPAFEIMPASWPHGTGDRPRGSGLGRPEGKLQSARGQA
jgi:hypothetical protein